MLRLLSSSLLAVVVWTTTMGAASAHHVLGRPAYNLGEDSNTPSSLVAEVQIGDYMATYMVFPAFPQPNAPGRISLYVSRLDNGETFDGKVTFKIRDDVLLPWFQNTHEETIGTQRLDDQVFRQSFQFSLSGDYIVSAQFESDGEPYAIDFPLRVGDVSSISPLVIIGGVILAVLIGVGITQRRRAMTGKVRGVQSEPKET
ncbi:MAG: hypothetical protein CMM60_03870 [Rhodospirillaceae bacterium]|jgi:hypothetical protein|nr:hypothetical protein [Rhodospirillaceae bacterium]|tara:strand:+ start:988 stop:1590 length:603 start_codon:yes stop_codon:yes gene_type:complete